ncbi:MAG: glycosyltransferase family 2 protein [Deltaproteobacteria bacterium]|nr:glycosyltransferase family 2 protein [Deltaproteobacteria bacterium]MBW2531869.1 glycosyltransferase family 2 protein [Deltaproteobacteria bacterium]
MSQTEISIVIPVYDEEAILHAAVVDLRERLRPLDWSYEILLCENGSRDRTAGIAGELAQRYADVRTFSIEQPNYGMALRRGIAKAAGGIVICDEIDLCDVDFHQRAVTMLRGGEVDLVVGSKLIEGAADERPWMRHAASQLYNGLLRVTLGFRGTDTHGLKAFRKAAVGPIAEQCVVDRDVFASELVIRAYRADLRVREIPIRLMEKRPPSINLVRRVPGVLRNLGRLAWAIYVQR